MIGNRGLLSIISRPGRIGFLSFSKRIFIMRDTQIIKREAELKDKFNEFFKNHQIENLYNQLSVEEMIELKKIISCINNIITLRATIAFVEKLHQDRFISDKEKKDIVEEVNGQHANTNGFDVHYDKNNDRKIIAEVKCNIPVDKTSFGPAQKDGIAKDIKNLFEGKKKANIKDISTFYKFMVILDCSENVRDCMQKIIDKKDHIKVYDSPNNLDKDNVFVVYIKLNQ